MLMTYDASAEVMNNFKNYFRQSKLFTIRQYKLDKNKG